MAKTSHVDSLFHHCGRICRHRLPDIFRMGPVRSPDGDLGTLLPGSFLCLHFASSSLWAQRNSGTCSAIWAADETGDNCLLHILGSRTTHAGSKGAVASA